MAFAKTDSSAAAASSAILHDLMRNGLSAPLLPPQKPHGCCCCYNDREGLCLAVSPALAFRGRNFFCFSFKRVAARVCCPESLNHLSPLLPSSAPESVHLSIPLSLLSAVIAGLVRKKSRGGRGGGRKGGKGGGGRGVHDCFDVIAVVVEEMMAADGLREGDIFCPIEDVGQVRARRV